MRLAIALAFALTSPLALASRTPEPDVQAGPGGDVQQAIAPTSPPPSGAMNEGALNLGGRDVTPLSGLVKVKGGDAEVAQIALPEGYLYFGPEDAQHIVEKLWGNPPDPTVHGLIIPPVADGDDEWGIIVSYDPQGHVDDSDAKELDYAALLEDMRKDAAEANPHRKSAGYPGMTLDGWAEPPHYDAAARKLFWAKKLTFDGAPQPTLNYDVRILGRKGVLLLSAVASVRMLEKVSEGSRAILAVTEFIEGHRYADFDPDIDEVAAVGIGGLIAGKVLLKGGLIAGLAKAAGGLLKPLLVVGAALIALIAKFLGKKNHGPPPGSDRQLPS